MRFILGTIIGSLITTSVFIAYLIWWGNNDLLYDHKIEPSSTIIEEDKYERLIKEVPSILIFYNPTPREHKKLHKWLKRHNIKHIHQNNKMISD